MSSFGKYTQKAKFSFQGDHYYEKVFEKDKIRACI